MTADRPTDKAAALPPDRDAPGGQAIVFHPELQHAYQTALGLQDAGLLDRFLTGLYYRPDAAPWSLLRRLPAGIGARLDRLGRRRHLAGLDQHRIETAPALALTLRLTDRSRLAATLLPRAGRWQRNALEAWAAGRVRERRPKGVICFDTNALDVFRAARAIGTLGILDQTIGHLTQGRRILAEEAAINPDFADSFDYRQPDWLVERCRAEALAADWVLAPSDYVRDSLTAIGVPPARIVAMPYGADVSRFAPAPERPSDRFRILFVGAISQRKGIKYLLEAVGRLDLPKAELVLVGPVIGSGRGLAPYAGRFSHVPQVPRAEIARHYRAADLFVYPSLHEGSAIAALEALASGLPVIATPNAGTVVRDGVEGYIVPIRDAAALADRIERLYRDRALRLAMAERARARALEFSWERYHVRLARWFAALPARAR